MGTRSYYFAEFPKDHPLHHLAVTSKRVLELNTDVDRIFHKYADKSNPQSPRKILFHMTRQVEALYVPNKSEELPFEIISSPLKKFPSLSSLKKKYLLFDDSGKTENFENESSALKKVFGRSFFKDLTTFPKRNEAVSSSHGELLPSISVEEKTLDHLMTVSKLKDVEGEIVFSNVQESAKAKIAENTGLQHPKIDAKRFAFTSKGKDEASNPAKRAKLSDSICSKISELTTSPDKSLIHPVAIFKMNASPNKDNKLKNCSSESEDDKIDESSIQDNEMKDGAIKLEDDTQGFSRTAEIAKMDVSQDNEIKDGSIKLEENTQGFSRTAKNDKMDVSPSKEETSHKEKATENAKMDVSPNKTKYNESTAENAKLEASPSKDETKHSPVKVKISKMSVSPNSNKTKDNESTNEIDKMYAFPKRDGKNNNSERNSGKIIKNSPCKSEYFEITELLSSIPIIKGDEIIFNVSVNSKENPNSTSVISISDDEEEDIILYNLDDENSRTQYIIQAIENRMKANKSLKGAKRVCYPSLEMDLNESPQKLENLSEPGNMVKKVTPFDDPENKLCDPNVFAYLKMRFTNILSHRNDYIDKIKVSFKDFKHDLGILYHYVRILSVIVEDIPMDDTEYSIEDTQILKDDMTRTCKELQGNLLQLIELVKSNISVWDEGTKEFTILKEENEALLSEDSNSLKLLQEYESNLRKIWDKMDNVIFPGNGSRSTLLMMLTDFVKLATDFARYLLMAGLLQPGLTCVFEKVKTARFC